MDDLPPLIWSITGDIRAARALAHLTDPRQPKHGTERTLVMNSVTGADAFSGVVIRASIEEHLASVCDGTVTIWPPTTAEVWETVHDLLGPLPDHCQFPQDAKMPVRDGRVFLPAQQVDDMETADLLARYVKVSGASAGLSVGEAGYLATALPALVENGLRYAPNSRCGVVVCGAVERETGDGQLVVMDLGDSVSGARDPSQVLKGCLEQSRRRFGGLTHIQRLAARRDLDASILLASGTARSRWRGQRWRHSPSAFVPGFCGGISTHPRGPRRGPRPVAPKSRLRLVMPGRDR
jgi:hypothetical protein